MRNNELAVNNHTNMLNMGTSPLQISSTSTWDAGRGFRPFVVQILCLINVIVKLNRECS